MLKKIRRKESLHPLGRVNARQLVTVHGQPVTDPSTLSPRVREKLVKPKGFNNLVVNVGRAHLARLLRGDITTYVNRLRLGDCKVDGLVDKVDHPADLSDTGLVHEITRLDGQNAATFDLDSDSSPDEVIKTDRRSGTPGTLTVTSLTDSGADFIGDGVNDRDTVTAYIGGESFTLGIVSVVSATELEVANPNELATVVGYSVQTPGTQALFSKVVSGDNFPEVDFGSDVVVHEAGLLFADGALFNRVTFLPTNNDRGLAVQATDVDGARIDLQFDWLITF